jgi:hypothetical protein
VGIHCWWQNIRDSRTHRKGVCITSKKLLLHFLQYNSVINITAASQWTVKQDIRTTLQKLAWFQEKHLGHDIKAALYPYKRRSCHFLYLGTYISKRKLVQKFWSVLQVYAMSYKHKVKKWKKARKKHFASLWHKVEKCKNASCNMLTHFTSL